MTQNVDTNAPTRIRIQWTCPVCDRLNDNETELPTLRSMLNAHYEEYSETATLTCADCSQDIGSFKPTFLILEEGHPTGEL